MNPVLDTIFRDLAHGDAGQRAWSPSRPHIPEARTTLRDNSALRCTVWLAGSSRKPPAARRRPPAARHDRPNTVGLRPAVTAERGGALPKVTLQDIADAVGVADDGVQRLQPPGQALHVTALHDPADRDRGSATAARPQRPSAGPGTSGTVGLLLTDSLVRRSGPGVHRVPGGCRRRPRPGSRWP